MSAFLSLTVGGFYYENFIRAIEAEGRPDVLGWAGDVLYPKIQEVFEEYSKKYGWGDPGSLTDIFLFGTETATPVTG